MNYLEEELHHARVKMETDKNKVILQKLMEKTGFEIDIEQESQRIFPRIAIITDPIGEIYYWNDGTKEAHRIVTFTKEKVIFDRKTNRVKILLEYF